MCIHMCVLMFVKMYGEIKKVITKKVLGRKESKHP